MLKANQCASSAVAKRCRKSSIMVWALLQLPASGAPAYNRRYSSIYGLPMPWIARIRRFRSISHSSGGN